MSTSNGRSEEPLGAMFTALTASAETPRSLIAAALAASGNAPRSLISEALAASAETPRNLIAAALAGSSANTPATQAALFAASMAAPSLNRSWNSGALALAGSRLRILEEGFQMKAGSRADTFGHLYSATAQRPGLLPVVERAIRTTQRPGSFGLDVERLRDDAIAVSETLDSGDGNEAVTEQLSEMQAETHIPDEVLWRWGDSLGWWKDIKSHQVSTAGLVLGYTVGLSLFVLGVGAGESIPQTLGGSIVAGGAIYFGVEKRELNSPKGPASS